ncbi:hypothetical protein KVV02_008048 [Mortierella alpina]|uniref:Mid2 domain-containing protein n=1 Tax=Mortierella alpina TaxID=64518 RepID=A0A9P8A813_MORAP|nr:hypothetical protein KVV02_008048 [Mortierella alpina]
MRVHSLRTWLAVPLLLALPAVMALVSAAEAEAVVPADNSLHGKLPMNTAFDRNILGHEAYAAATTEVDLELLDPEAGAPRESDPKRPHRSSQTGKRKPRTRTKPSITTHHSTLHTTASSTTRPQRLPTSAPHSSSSPQVPHSSSSPRASHSSQNPPRASNRSGVPTHATRPSSASSTITNTPTPTTTTRPDDPIIILPLPEEPTSDTTHSETATRTVSRTVSASPSVSVSASHTIETSRDTVTQTSSVPSPTGSSITPDDTPTGPHRNSSATLTASSTGPRRTGTISWSISGSSTITATASRPTGVSSRITTAPPRTTMTTTTTTTTTKTKATKTRTHKPGRTKTPWLPSSIEPVKPPKVTATPSPGTSLPDVVIPNLKPQIPRNNFPVNLRFQQVSYYQVISNGILAAQLVNFIPAQLAPLLKVDEDKILVLAIRDGRSGGSSSSSSSSSSRRAKKRALVTTQDEDDSIRVVVSIPQSKYWVLNDLVSNRHSALYTPTADGFGQYLDWNYPLSNRPPPPVSSGSKGSNGNNGGNHNPLTGDHLGAGDPDQATGGSGSSNGAVIGSLIGLATVAYVGIALVVVRTVRRKRLREQEAQAKMSPKNISAPVRVQGGSQGWGWQGS